MDCPIAKLVRTRRNIIVRAAAATAGAFLCWMLAALPLAVLPGALTAGPTPASASAGPVALGEGGRWWKIRITRQGLYQIGCNQLAAVLGVPVPDVATLQLYLGAAGALPPAEVALREVDSDGDRRCDAGEGDAVEFWGDPNPGRYDAGAYYWLTSGSAPGLRMARRPSAPGGAPPAPLWRTQLVEENHYYRSSMPVAEAGEAGGGAHDHWFWTFLALGSSTFPAQHDFSFTLGDVAQGDTLPAAAAFVTITLAALGGSHRVQASINGVGLGDLAWQGSALYEGVLSVPPDILRAGENRLSLSLAGTQAGALAGMQAGAQAEVAVAADSTALRDPVSAAAALSPVLVDHFAVTYRPAHPLLLGDASDAVVVGIEPGSWQLQLGSAAIRQATLLDIGDPLHPVEVAPLCDPGACWNTWGLGGPKAGIYAVVPAGARLGVDAIVEDIPSQWRTPANGADYILIAHRNLWSSAERLANHRRGQGLRVALVDVQDIYDEFNGSQVDAEAIRAFLVYAWSNWQPPAPTYVLLLGDGTFDPCGYCTPPGACPELVTTPNSTLIPPYLASVDPWLGETAADNRFVALDGASSLPWLAIGRLPAADAAEAQAMVDKILAYEASLPAQAGGRVLAIGLVSDNAYAANGTLDPAGNFWQASDAALYRLQQAAAANGVQLAVARFYLNICETGRFPHCSLSDPPYRLYADAASLVAALAAWLAAPSQSGTASPIVHYVGHGAITGWAGQPPLLQTADAATLGAAPRLPVVLDMTCYTGYFHFPGLQSLAEAWLAAPQHGAVAVIASSGLDLVAAHATFDSALLAELGGKPATTIGQAFLAAKLAAAAGLSQDIDTFHLFGDPAMPLWVAAPAPTSTPLPTTPAAMPTLQTPDATPIPSLMPPITPEVPPTPAPVPDPLPDFAFYLYLPWLPTELER